MQKKAQKTDALSLPQQRYIETIAELSAKGRKACTKDIAARLKVRLPSVSEAVKRLVSNGLATRASRFEISLSPKGWRVAQQLNRRHQSLKRFMQEVVAMDEARADEIACRVEHCVDSDFAGKLRILAEFLEKRYPQVLKEVREHIAKNAPAADSSMIHTFDI